MSELDYHRCLESMYKLRRFGIKLGLETIGCLLEKLGNPQQRFRCIHIAGTNGKGSVAAMLSAIFHTAGYKVGRYTSPHLERFNERICIGNQPISDANVIAAYEWIRSHWDLEHNPNKPDDPATQNKREDLEGLYYCYHMFARALRAWGHATIDDRTGKEHNWREELIDALAKRVGENGSWRNTGADRWAEADPVYATTLSVLALQEALKK